MGSSLVGYHGGRFIPVVRPWARGTVIILIAIERKEEKLLEKFSLLWVTCQPQE